MLIDRAGRGVADRAKLENGGQIRSAGRRSLAVPLVGWNGQSGLSRHCKVGKNVSADDCRILRPDAPGSSPEAHHEGSEKGLATPIKAL